MNGHDELLRRVLHDAADRVDPTGSFGDVRSRAGRFEKRARNRRMALAAAAVIVAVAIAVPLVSRGDSGDQVDVVSPTGEPTPAPTGTPPPATPTPSPTSGPTVAPTPEPSMVAGIHPFISALDADDWPGPSAEDGRDYTDPRQAVLGFLVDELGASNLQVGEVVASGPGRGVVTATEPVTGIKTYVVVAQLGGSGAWTVVSVSADRLAIDSPTVGDEVNGPVAVRGRVSAFEGSVLVEVRTRADGPEAIGFIPAIGGAGAELEGFEAVVDLDPVASLGPGSVVATTVSARDGSIEQVAAVPVMLVQPEGGPGPVELPAGDPFGPDEAVVVLTESGGELPTQRIAVIDVASGAEARTLAEGIDTSEGGVLDVALSADRRTVLVIRSTSACDSVLEAFASDGTGGVVEVERRRPRLVAVSPAGVRTVIATDSGCDGVSQLLVSDSDGPTTIFGGPGGFEVAGLATGDTGGLPATVTAAAWADDSTLVYVVRYEDGTALFSLSVDDGSSVRLADGDVDAEWSGLAPLSSGRVSALRTCCLADPRASEVVTVETETSVITADFALAEPAPGARLAWLPAAPGGTLLWLDAEGDLHRGEAGDEMVLRRDVVTFAS